VLTVDCSVDTQIARVMSRNGFSREQVLAIIARQATREARLAAADDVIVNDNQPFEELEAQVDAHHRVYLSLANGEAEI
jgi:dephospho-CoA kinase